MIGHPANLRAPSQKKTECFAFALKRGINCCPWVFGGSRSRDWSSRYVAKYRQGQEVPKSWTFFFELNQQPGLSAAQHMLAGTAPHILHDLPLAIAEVVPKEGLLAFKQDFELMNRIFLHIIDEVQVVLGRQSFGMRLADTLLCRADEAIAMTALSAMRDSGFEGVQLAKEGGGDQLDSRALSLEQVICGAPSSWLLCCVGVPEPSKFAPLVEQMLDLPHPSLPSDTL
ncbi:unnamed protein product [Effrenium voratum]|nr:unnamed protein product [Effrenium voratum]